MQITIPREEIVKAESTLVGANVQVMSAEQAWRNAGRDDGIVTKECQRLREAWWTAIDARSDAERHVSALKKQWGTAAFAAVAQSYGC